MIAKKVAKKNKTTEDVLLILCKAVQKILTQTTNNDIHYSPMVQKITKTCLKPDIGCFVLFEGAFSGLIIINMSSGAALEIYQAYMQQMGFSHDEISDQHTSDDVSNVLGELMNQIVGDFQGELEHQLSLSISQTQPKMLVVNKELILSINANIERPQSRRVVFRTSNHKTFNLEMSMERTEFIELDDPGNTGFSDSNLTKDEQNQAFLDDLDI
jgi:chemotaxis protein CheY-P-specific phosphatase CheC